MGWPVAHSLSPRLHGYWLRHYGIDGAYVPLPVRPERLGSALRALADLGFAGCNLTVPHKDAALGALDEIAEDARRIGAVNTILVRADGSLYGWNTDIEGFAQSLIAALPEWSIAGKHAVVLGAGGAARAVVAAVQNLGAEEVVILNRTRERAETLATDLGGAIRPLAWERRSEALSQAALLINTTTLGMLGKPPLSIDLAPLPTDAVVADIVYAPLGMLLYQAVPGFEAWFGRRPEVTPALRDFVLAPS
jgi:shikimate dehydrogenase